MAETVDRDPSKDEKPTDKKKRTADHQITKDEYDEEERKGDSDEHEKGGFVKADAEVLKKRRIVKARRPVATVTTDEEAPKSANPFATTVLKANDSTNDSGDKPKVFGSGSGFSGFAGAASSSTGFGSSSGGGFGSGTAYKGFGTLPSSTGFGFGSATSTTTTTPSESGASSPTINNLAPSFGFGKPATVTASSADSAEKEEETLASSSNQAALKLPDEVKLTTGEESERILVELRVKTFKMVPCTEKDDKEPSETEGSATAPSVPPSSSSFTKLKANTEIGTTEVENNDASGGNLDGKSEKANSTEMTALKWQDLGVGPLKLLEGGPNKLRLVQRYQGKNPGDKPTKVLLNHPLWKESKVMKTDNKYLQLDLLIPTEDKKLKKQTYSIKFKSEAEADIFFDVLTHEKSTAKSCFVRSTVSEPSTTAESST